MSRTDSAPPPQANPPVRRPPGHGFVVGSLLMAWRWLRRMRTALYLLGALALLTLLATIVPQEPNVPVTVARWRSGEAGPGEVVSALIELVGGYDVYGSPAFLAFLLLLVISLTACLIPRWRAWWRVARRSRPPVTSDPGRQPLTATVDTPQPPDRALATARGVLADRRYRTRDADDRSQIAAEKGVALREGGSLLFHTSWYVILAAVVAGQLLGFSGQVGIIEGQSWTDTEVGYWNADPGRLWDETDHDGFTMTLDRFEVDWYRDTAQPRTFLSHVTVREPGGQPYQDVVGGNDPLVVDGMKIHQLDWGYAPRVVVEVDGEVVHDALLTPTRTDAGFWRGAVKAPAAEPDVGLQIELYPSTTQTQAGPMPTGAPWTDDPLLVMRAYRGDLNLTSAQNVNDLDLRDLEETDVTALGLGTSVTLAGDVQVSFPELRRWVGFQVSNRPTVPWLLLGSGMLLAGLIPALYAYRRRVWVCAEAGGSGTRVTVAGRAFQRQEAFAGEHERLVSAIRGALVDGADPPDGPRPDRPKTDPDIEAVPR